MDNNPVYDYVRVYFNSHEDANKAWSIDSGPGTTEYQTALVILIRPVAVITETNLDADNVTQPKGWQRVAAARLKFKDGFIEVY